MNGTSKIRRVIIPFLSFFICIYSAQARNWRSCPGGKTCLYKHFGGIKAIFCYVNHKVKYSAGDKIMQSFSFGGNAPCPLQVRA